MSDADPTRVPFAAWAAFRPIVLARLGAERLAEIESYWLDPGRALAEPQTQAAVLARMGEALRIAPLTAAEQASLASSLPAILASTRPPPPSPATRAVMEIVGAARAKDVAAVERIVSQFRVADASTRWIPSASDGVLTPKYGFERHAAFIARFLWKNAESVYKPMLRAALELTWIAAGEPKQAANMLGNLVGQCERAWTPDVVKVLIDRRLSVIRNSEAHQHTVFNAANEVVTFMNDNNSAATPPLAMSASELAVCTAELTTLCASMFAGFIRP